jgi:hypothetical protein
MRASSVSIWLFCKMLVDYFYDWSWFKCLVARFVYNFVGFVKLSCLLRLIFSLPVIGLFLVFNDSLQLYQQPPLPPPSLISLWGQQF